MPLLETAQPIVPSPARAGPRRRPGARAVRVTIGRPPAPAWPAGPPSASLSATMYAAPGACRLVLEITEAANIDAALFLYQAVAAFDGNLHARFQRACSPEDLGAWPEGGPPPAGPGWFRMPSATLDFPDAASAAACVPLVVAQLQEAVAAVAALRALASADGLAQTLGGA